MRVICAGRLDQIGVAMKLYADTNKEFLPTSLHDETGDPEMHGFVVYRKDWTYSGSNKLMPLRFARLYESGLIDVPEIFYCPGNTNPDYKYESYTNPAPWGTLDQEYNKTKTNPNQWVRIGYTYYPVERNAKLLATGYPDPKKPVLKYTLLNLNLPYATDVLHSLESLSHQSNKIYAVNALYGDGHVSACTDQTVFKSSIWTDGSLTAGTVEGYQRAYYTIFRLIGP
jgi:prepilin-type processing-associated H-X9-DG protein